MGCVVCQAISATSENAEHTLNVLTSPNIGDTRGFARYYQQPLSARDVPSVGGHGSEKKLSMLGIPMQDDGNHWHRWVGNVTRHLSLEIRRALDITLGTRHQIPADGSAVAVGGRDHRSLVQGSFRGRHSVR